MQISAILINKQRLHFSDNHPPILARIRQVARAAIELARQLHACGTAPSTPWTRRVVYQLSTTLAACALLYRIVPASIHTKVVYAPILEEVLFRYCLQTLLEKVQKIVSRVRTFIFKTTFSLQDLKAQAVFRVRVQGVIFGLVHAMNPHKTVAGKVIQVVHSAWSGMIYGYLKESTHSIVPGIALHAMNNGSVAFGKLLAQDIPNDIAALLVIVTPFALHHWFEWNIYKKNQFE